MSSITEDLLNKIVWSIDFNILTQVFSSKDMQRFRDIFPHYQQTINLASSDETKKQFVYYCIETDKKKKEFIGLLLHCGQYRAALFIDVTIEDIINSSKLDPSGGRITSKWIDFDPYRDVIKRRDKPSSLSLQYSMSSSPRGKCLIINNYLTFGTFNETQRLRNIFYQLHFDVILENNLTAQEIMAKLDSLSVDPMLANHDAFAFLIISHGTKEGEIFGFDSNLLKIKEICEKFDDNHCPNMIGKPRIFAFNCCRGDLLFDGSEPMEIDWTDLKLAKSFTHTTPVRLKYPELPEFRDIFVCYSTLDGRAAYVDWNTGTRFGEELCNSFVKRGWYRDFNQILTAANNELREKQPITWKQCSTNAICFKPSIPCIKKLP